MNEERFWKWFWEYAVQLIQHCENNCPYREECLKQNKYCDEFLRKKFLEYGR